MVFLKIKLFEKEYSEKKSVYDKKKQHEIIVPSNDFNTTEKHHDYIIGKYQEYFIGWYTCITNLRNVICMIISIGINLYHSSLPDISYQEVFK